METTIVDARRTLWKSSAGRLGQDAKLKMYEGFVKDVYAEDVKTVQ